MAPRRQGSRKGMRPGPAFPGAERPGLRETRAWRPAEPSGRQPASGFVGSASAARGRTGPPGEASSRLGGEALGHPPFRRRCWPDRSDLAVASPALGPEGRVNSVARTLSRGPGGGGCWGSLGVARGTRGVRAAPRALATSGGHRTCPRTRAPRVPLFGPRCAASASCTSLPPPRAARGDEQEPPPASRSLSKPGGAICRQAGPEPALRLARLRGASERPPAHRRPLRPLETARGFFSGTPREIPLFSHGRPRPRPTAASRSRLSRTARGTRGGGARPNAVHSRSRAGVGVSRGGRDGPRREPQANAGSRGELALPSSDQYSRSASESENRVSSRGPGSRAPSCSPGKFSVGGSLLPWPGH
jgi:hypothetical protein